MTAYEKSNSIEKVALSRLSKKEYQALLAVCESIKDRQKAAQALCNYLSDRFHISHTKVNVVNRAQPHSTGYSGRLRSKTLGTYTVNSEVITMYNITAVKRQPVSIKVFAGTLLHEFMHHYDMKYLKLNNSIHTAGFYKRISDLESKIS